MYKFDKLTCFKCGKKGHKIYDCQILIVPSSSYTSYHVEREAASIENQRRGWMKEENQKAKCVQCGAIGHQYCTNDHHSMCANDQIYITRSPSMVVRDLFAT